MNKQVHICVPRITTPPRPVLEASYGTVRTGVRFRNEKLVSQCSDIAQIESLRTGMKMPDCCAMCSRINFKPTPVKPFPETGKRNNNDSDTLDSESGTGSESESENMSDEKEQPTSELPNQATD
ncbi:hypothetical protein U1Q18_048294 [Sarracenia purpurea var. burkii]